MAGAVIAILGVYERFAGRELAGLYWALALVLVVVAFFLAWRGEHRVAARFQRETDSIKEQLVEATRTNRPDFDGAIEQLACEHFLEQLPGEPVQGGLEIYALVSVRNKGADSMLEKWHASLHTPTGILKAEMATVRENVFRVGNADMRVGPGDSIDEKTYPPVRRGAIERGWLCFRFRPLTIEQLKQPGHVLEIRFTDVEGTRYKISRGFTGKESETARYYPGSGTISRGGND